MAILKELKDFMMRGNVVDMAVGIIVGGAFGKIVSSLVSDIVMPPIGVLLGGINFSEFKYVIKSATDDAAAVSINYGSFIQTVLDFVIIATVIFFAIKGINSLRKAPEEKSSTPPAPSREEILLTEIRDLLKEKK